jgi:hypothetical protein
MTVYVIARPRPSPRNAGATQIMPTHPTRPETVATPVPTIAPSRSARIGRQFGWVAAKRKKASRSPQSPRRTASAAAATSNGNIGRTLVPGGRTSCSRIPRSWHTDCSSVRLTRRPYVVGASGPRPRMPDIGAAAAVRPSCSPQHVGHTRSPSPGRLRVLATQSLGRAPR